MEGSRLTRLTAILIALQSKRLITATTLAKRFEVSIRTIYRDIRALEQAGVPIVTEEGRGYSLVPGYSLPPVMFSEEEANALITAAKLIARNKDGSLIKHHQSAIEKIKAILQYVDKDKAELLEQRVAFIKNFNQTVTSYYLVAVQRAITNLLCLKIEYESLGDAAISTRVIEPQALYSTQENWILISWCRLRQGYREFRLDRIRSLHTLNEHFEPRKFVLLDYFLGKLK